MAKNEVLSSSIGRRWREGDTKGQNGGENGEGRGANARNKSLPRDRGRDLKLVDRAAEGALRLADLSIDHIG